MLTARPKKTTSPLFSPTVCTPAKLVACSTSVCTRMTSHEIGNNNAPIPRKSGRRRMYIRHDALRIWPHARRRATWSGAVGRHVARAEADDEQQHEGSEQEAELERSVHEVDEAREPLPTAPQKKSVAAGPNALPTGTV